MRLSLNVSPVAQVLATPSPLELTSSLDAAKRFFTASAR
jgi:hypothetical protein